MLSITGLGLEQFARLMQGMGYVATEGTRPKRKPEPVAAPAAQPLPPRASPSPTRREPDDPGAARTADVPVPAAGRAARRAGPAPTCRRPSLPEMPETTVARARDRRSCPIRRRPPPGRGRAPIRAEAEAEAAEAGAGARPPEAQETETVLHLHPRAAAPAGAPGAARAAGRARSASGKPRPPAEGERKGKPRRGPDEGRKGKREGPREEEPVVRARPPRPEKPIDPDNPFAALMALKLRPLTPARWPSRADAIRLDKWLWQARFCKSRALAARLIADGAIRVNAVRVTKPATTVRVGDGLSFAQGGAVRAIRVRALGTRRGPAPEARAALRRARRRDPRPGP